MIICALDVSAPALSTHFLQFLNAHPSNGTGGIWPNTWINANETGPAQVSALLDTSVWM